MRGDGDVGSACLAIAHSLGSAPMFHPVRCISMQQTSVERSQISTQTFMEAITSALSRRVPDALLQDCQIVDYRQENTWTVLPFSRSATVENSPGRYDKNTTGSRFSVSTIIVRDKVTRAMTMKERRSPYIAEQRYGMEALIAAPHHSNSPARGPVQTSMQTTFTHAYDNAALLANDECAEIRRKPPTVLSRHPQDEPAG